MLWSRRLRRSLVGMALEDGCIFDRCRARVGELLLIGEVGDLFGDGIRSLSMGY